MKIGILSDSHGSLYSFERAMALIGDYDYLIHCGDVLPTSSRSIEGGYQEDALAKKLSAMPNVYFALGNGDFVSQALMPSVTFEKHLLLQLGDYKIFVTHGHLYSRMSMIMKALEAEADLLCYGHSHIKELDYYEDLLVLNPGSIALPRDGSPSCAILENDLISIYRVDTGEKIAGLSLNKA